MTIDELELRTGKVWTAMEEAGCDALILRSVPNLIYMTGTGFSGFIYIKIDELPILFLERPCPMIEESKTFGRVHRVRKQELIPDILQDEYGLTIDGNCAVELSFLPVNEYERLRQLSTTERFSTVDASTLMREVRSIKTPNEIDEIREIAGAHMEIYKQAPDLFRRGMTDLEWQVELERLMRLHGSIGVFRSFGSRMEIFMGNVAAGANARVPAPYDFAMGGAGTPAMPMGATGIVIKEGTTVMVDLAGNFGRYNTDITRVYALGHPDLRIINAHQLSEKLHRYFMDTVKPGVEIATIYNHCIEEVQAAGLEKHFMGQDYQAKFVGHGVGIEINELPVLTGRAKGVFEPNMVIAFEPKFVIDDIGACGVENTYLVTENGVENLSPIGTEIKQL